MNSPTSTRPSASLFAEPEHAAACYRSLRRILRTAFHPEHALRPPGRLDLRLDGHAASLSDVLTEIEGTIAAHAVHPRHPEAMAHMSPPPLTVSVLADLVIGALNQCAFIWEEAPLGAVLEDEVLRWLADRIGYGEHAGGLLTSGGTMSNCVVTYLALERARRRPPGVPLDRLRIICSDQAHLSVEKAAALTGLGERAVVRIPTGQTGRLSSGAVKAALAGLARDGLTPFLLLATAGTTNAGVMEPAAEFFQAARDERAWFHVDAAHGGFLSLVPEARSATESWSEADSVSWDPHKTLYASYASGALLFRQRPDARGLTFQGEYALKPESAPRDAGAGHFEGSRRLEALKLWMCIRHLGIQGYRELSARVLGLARELAILIRAKPDFAILTEPDTNIVCFRFEPSGVGALQGDRLNSSIQAALFRRGGPLLSTTRVGRRVVLRAVLMNPLIEQRDLDCMLTSVAAEGARQLQSGRRPGLRMGVA